MDLFREAAIAELKQQRYGKILLIRPPSLMVYTLFFLIVISVIVYFFFTFEASRKVVLRGMLVSEHGAIHIYPAAPSLLLSTRFYDGQQVKKGDELFVLSLEESAKPHKKELSGDQARVSSVIFAPCDGIISVLAGPGQTVSTALPLAAIFPEDDPLMAVLFADGATAGLIRPGDKVSLHYMAYPFQKFGRYDGTVVAVSDRPAEISDIPFFDKKTANADALYKIRVKLNEQTIKAYGKTIRHKHGMRLEASITVERRKLYQWIIPSI